MFSVEKNGYHSRQQCKPEEDMAKLKIAASEIKGDP
jgi:hypothetical protein